MNNLLFNLFWIVLYDTLVSFWLLLHSILFVPHLNIIKQKKYPFGDNSDFYTTNYEQMEMKC